MSDDSKGSPLSQRLMSRQAGGPGLHRVSMADGGEAYSGALADRALGALGARAFTVDKSVIVNRSFDRAKAEDQALYAHERFHQRAAGQKAEGAEGGASHDGKDAEEMAARAMEAMVLHRAKGGDDFGSIMSDVNSGSMDDAAKGGGRGGEGGEGGGNDPKKAKVSGALIGGGKDRDPMDGYKALLKDGRTHWQIVNELKDYVVVALERISEEHEFRSAEGSFLSGETSRGGLR